MDLNIEDFVRTYVDAAFASVPLECSIPLQDFDEKVRIAVSEKMGVSREIILRLHHSFHWTLFNRDGNSPLELMQPFGTDKSFRVARKKEYPPEDAREQIVRYLLENYRPYLLARLKS